MFYQLWHKQLHIPKFVTWSKHVIQQSPASGLSSQEADSLRYTAVNIWTTSTYSKYIWECHVLHQFSRKSYTACTEQLTRDHKWQSKQFSNKSRAFPISLMVTNNERINIKFRSVCECFQVSLRL